MRKEATNEIGSVSCGDRSILGPGIRRTWRNDSVPSIQLNKKGSARPSQDCRLKFSMIWLARIGPVRWRLEQVRWRNDDSRKLCSQPTSHGGISKELTERLDEEHCRVLVERVCE